MKISNQRKHRIVRLGVLTLVAAAIATAIHFSDFTKEEQVDDLRKELVVIDDDLIHHLATHPKEDDVILVALEKKRKELKYRMWILTGKDITQQK